MPRSARNFSDPNLLEAALEGLMLQRQRIDSQIQEVRALLRRKHNPASSATEHTNGRKPAGGRRELSEAARRRIAAAQKKRWAEYRKTHSKGE